LEEEMRGVSMPVVAITMEEGEKVPEKKDETTRENGKK